MGVVFQKFLFLSNLESADSAYVTTSWLIVLVPDRVDQAFRPQRAHYKIMVMGGYRKSLGHYWLSGKTSMTNHLEKKRCSALEESPAPNRPGPRRLHANRSETGGSAPAGIRQTRGRMNGLPAAISAYEHGKNTSG